MTKTPDDLDAVRAVVTALQDFDENNQERIIRWAREKLGLSVPSPAAAPKSSHPSPLPTQPEPGQHPPAPSPSTHKPGINIKQFVAEKAPKTDVHFATTVAYYYRFEAPEKERKESINSDDLKEACRQVGRTRLPRPHHTLRDAHDAGLLDRSGERGEYSINTVGENLVAMTLPLGGKSGAPPRLGSKKKTSTKKATLPRKGATKTKKQTKTSAKSAKKSS